MRGQEVFRGHLDECMSHLNGVLDSRIPKGARGAGEARKPITIFCGVSMSAATDWFHGAGSLPQGEHLIKLECFLDMQGYRIIELENMPQALRNFAELIGFGLLSGKEAARLLGYAKAMTVYQILRGEYKPNPDKKERIWSIWKERREALKQKKEEARRLYCLNIEMPKEKQLIEARTEFSDALSARSIAIIRIIEGLSELLEEFDNFSENDLANLKRFFGNSIFQLSARLSALSAKIILPHH